jgi:hypothetical protein
MSESIVELKSSNVWQKTKSSSVVKAGHEDAASCAKPMRAYPAAYPYSQ